MYGFIIVVGTITNSLVIIFFGFKTKEHLSFHWFLIHLAVADGICCIVTPVLNFYLLATGYEWHLGSLLCKTITPVGFITVNVSAWILCGIAYERYRSIGDPLKARFSKKHINLVCSCMWFGSALLAVPLFTWTEVSGSVCQPTWTPKQHFVVGMLGLLSQSLIPIVVMAISFLFIRKAFHLQNSKILIISGKKRMNRMQSKAKITTQTLLIAFLTFVVCSLPYNVLYLLTIIMFRFNVYTREESQQYSGVYDKFGFWLSYLVVANSVMNCFIYAGKFPAFRKFLFIGLSGRRSYASGNRMNEGNGALNQQRCPLTSSFALRQSKWKSCLFTEQQTIF